MKTDRALASAPLSAQPHPTSLWVTAGKPSPALARLERNTSTDVVVIGGGITGLNAAWELSRRGEACVLLEANDAGWGASGRNGGMAVLRYKKPWSTLAKKLGDEVTVQLHARLIEALDILERNVRELGIDCGFKRSGHITAANGPRAVAWLTEDCRWLAAHGDRTPRMLGEKETRELIGTEVYCGGYLDTRAAGVQPLDYSRGFAAALAARGVPVFRESPVLELRLDGDGVVALTPGGEVRARKALVCSNAYTELHPFASGLARRIVPVSTSVVTTAPLSPQQMRGILPRRHLVSDTKHLLNYFRWVAGNRLLFGGRGSLTGEEKPQIYDGLIAKMRKTFPQLSDAAVDHRWSGKVAVTLDDFPHLGALDDRVFFALGYGGRGVALANLLGRELALRALGEPVALGPVTDAPFGRVPLHALRIPGMNIVATYYKMRDALRI